MDGRERHRRHIIFTFAPAPPKYVGISYIFGVSICTQGVPVDWNNPTSVERKISRLQREIRDIEHFYYESNVTDDRTLYAGMLERKRDDVVRAAVLQLHTAIEDLLNIFILSRMLGVKPSERKGRLRSAAGKAVYKMLYGGGSIGFDMKLNLAVAVGAINSRTATKLQVLNSLRNKCSHNWLLKTPIRRGKRPSDKKPPLLKYQNRDLHNVQVLKDFVGEYGALYARLFLKYS